MENYTFKHKISDFFKKYGYYFLLGLLTIGVVLTLIIVNVSGNNVEEDSVPTNSAVTPFMPVLNATLYKEYYGDELMYNATLKQWETHNGIDLQVANGSKVYSILDGKVKDIYSNVLEGTVVVIEHDNGLTSSYGSLDSELNIEVGDSISRGDEIGKVSASAYAESDAGTHLHFSLMENDKKVDPASYLNIQTNK